MKTKKTIPILAILAGLILLSTIAFGQTVAVSRTIAPITQTNQEFQVTLSINAGSADPSGLIISETIPETWAIVRADDSCVINQAKRLIKCVTYGENIANALRYTLKSPATKPSQSAVITGDWKTLSNSGTITGGLLEIVEPQAPAPPTPDANPSAGRDVVDNSPLIYGIIIVIAVLIIVGGFVWWKTKAKAKAN